MKKCPYCAEEIQSSAKKCRYCGEWLDRSAPKRLDEENPEPAYAVSAAQPVRRPEAHRDRIPVGSGRRWIVAASILGLLGIGAAMVVQAAKSRDPLEQFCIEMSSSFPDFTQMEMDVNLLPDEAVPDARAVIGDLQRGGMAGLYPWTGEEFYFNEHFCGGSASPPPK